MDISAYSEAFDFYMETESLPEDAVPSGSGGEAAGIGEGLGMALLGEKLRSCEGARELDELRQEALKESLMALMDRAERLLSAIRDKYSRERKDAEDFAKEEPERQKESLPAIRAYLKRAYKAGEVNVDAYMRQIEAAEKDGRNGEDAVRAALRSMANDWLKTVSRRMEAEMEEAVSGLGQRWAGNRVVWGNADTSRRERILRRFRKYPQLEEIVRIIGRAEPRSEELKDDTVIRYAPGFVMPSVRAAEKEEIREGDDIGSMLPSETAILSDPDTELLFYYKLVTKRLGVFANRPEDNLPSRTERKQVPKPRLEKGPMIVSIDTSGSMYGEPVNIAIAIVLQLVRLARKQKRNCFLISFAVRAQSIDLADMRNADRLEEFLKGGFTGGTSLNAMCEVSLDTLKSRNYSMADVLIISDFEVNYPTKRILDRIGEEKRKGTRFYGLCIGREPMQKFGRFLDRSWRIE